MLDEYFYLFKYKLMPPKQKKWWLMADGYTLKEKELIGFCYDMLEKVSRSFSYVIRCLSDELSLEVCIFYLMCRALDTVEDDVNAFDGDLEQKKKYLSQFYKGFDTLSGVGEALYRPLLENYDKIGIVFNLLCPKAQSAIKMSVRKIGGGMSKYIQTDIQTMKEYNKYCYYVAGLVGKGLTVLFMRYDSGLQQVESALSINMGLFLQKTNIIRDYKEDLDAGLHWYPKVIWHKYKDQFTDFNGDVASRNCLNELVLDALQNISDIFRYHTYITNKSIFQFCAIPQIMAIATLSKLYDNPDVFHKNVKIRKGLSLKIMNQCNTMDDLYFWFMKFIREIQSKIRTDDPHAHEVREVCQNLLRERAEAAGGGGKSSFSLWAISLNHVLIIFCSSILLYFFWWLLSPSASRGVRSFPHSPFSLDQPFVFNHLRATPIL